MATITFNIPDNQAGRLSNAQLLDNFCAANGYTGTRNGQAETKLQFLKRKTVEFWFSASVTAERATLITNFTPTPGPDIT